MMASLLTAEGGPDANGCPWSPPGRRLGHPPLLRRTRRGLPGRPSGGLAGVWSRRAWADAPRAACGPGPPLAHCDGDSSHAVGCLVAGVALLGRLLGSTSAALAVKLACRRADRRRAGTFLQRGWSSARPSPPVLLQAVQAVLLPRTCLPRGPARLVSLDYVARPRGFLASRPRSAAWLPLRSGGSCIALSW